MVAHTRESVSNNACGHVAEFTKRQKIMIKQNYLDRICIKITVNARVV